MAEHASWLVARVDDNGRRFLVFHGMGREEAETVTARMNARGHKQSAWAEGYVQGGLDAALEALDLLR